MTSENLSIQNTEVPEVIAAAPADDLLASVGVEPTDHLPGYLQEAFNEAGVELKNARLERLQREQAERDAVIAHVKANSVLYKLYGQNILNMLDPKGNFNFNIPTANIPMLKEQIDHELSLHDAMPLAMFGMNNTFVEFPGMQMPVSVNSLTQRIRDLRRALDFLVDTGHTQRADQPLRLKVGFFDGYNSAHFLQNGEHNGPTIAIGEIQQRANMRNHLSSILLSKEMEKVRAEKEAELEQEQVQALGQAMNQPVIHGEGVTAEEMAAQLQATTTEGATPQ